MSTAFFVDGVSFTRWRSTGASSVCPYSSSSCAEEDLDDSRFDGIIDEFRVARLAREY